MSTTNKTVSTVEAIIHFAIMDVAVNAAIAAMTAEVPFLGLPVIKQMVRFIVEKFAAFFAMHLERAAAFAVIDAQTNAQAAEYKEAVEELKTAQTSGDPHALSQATERFKEKLRDLIRFNRDTGK